MTATTFYSPQETLAPRSRADLAREEQAFYEKHADAGSWINALKLLATAPVVFGLYLAVLQLIPAAH